MGFSSLKKMIDIQSRIFFCKYSYALSYSDIPRNHYSKILKVIDEAESKVEFNEEKVKDNTLSGIIEWIMISTSKFIVKDNELLLAKLRRDITSITPLDTREIGAMRLEILTTLAL